MNATTRSNAETGVLTGANADFDSRRVVDLDRGDAHGRSASNQARLNNSVFHFFDELSRRQVCRTITTYSIGLWLVCQVVDLVNEPLGLPDWTLRFIIVIGLIGFPIALILSWLFDITRDGVVPDRTNRVVAGQRRPFDRVLDCSLVLAATVIGVQLATGVLTSAEAAAPPTQKIAVLAFSAGENAEAVAHGLVSELQYELVNDPGITPIAGRGPFPDRDGLSLTGAVAVGSSIVRVTATLIDNRTGEVTWADVFEVELADEIHAPAYVARKIVVALPRNTGLRDDSGAGHDS